MMSLLLKIVYSALLIGLVGVAVRELWTVWLDPRVYIGKFDVVTESGEDSEKSDAFAKRIVAAQTILAQQLTDYQSRNSANTPSDTTYAISGMEPLLLPPEALAGIDITVQNVNLRQLLSVVRRNFLAPNEVSGQVTARDGSVLAAVDWPRAPRLANGSTTLTKFLAPGRGSAQEVAAYIACSISWARAASGNAKFATYPRSQFCDFVAALGSLYALEEKASSSTGLSTEETAQVQRRAALLRSRYSDNAVFPDLYRLRADLLDLLPEKSRTLDDLAEAQEDRVRYAMLSREIQALPEDTRRMAALALARPAIVIESGKLKDVRENWTRLLNRHAAEISAAAQSTGLVVDADDQPKGTGFIVAPGMLMTVAAVISPVQLGSGTEVSEQAMRLCLGHSETACDSSLKIGKTLYDGKHDGSIVVLAELLDHDPILNPPLLLASPLSDSNSIVGNYAYIVGYPFYDPRLPHEFVSLLLGSNFGRAKRLMPGRVLAFSPAGPKAPWADTNVASAKILTTDISTMGGTAGGPLFDLNSGTVIGVNWGGLWQGERGKFANSAPIPPGAFDCIKQRVSEEITKTVDSPGDCRLPISKSDAGGSGLQP
jgi:hypothetical protein